MSGRRVDNTRSGVSIDDPGATSARRSRSARPRPTPARASRAPSSSSRPAAPAPGPRPRPRGTRPPSPTASTTCARSRPTTPATRPSSTVLGREVDNTTPQTAIDSAPPSLDNDRTPTLRVLLERVAGRDLRVQRRRRCLRRRARARPRSPPSPTARTRSTSTPSTSRATSTRARPRIPGRSTAPSRPSRSTFPDPGALVSGIVTLTASATDASGAPDVRFEISVADARRLDDRHVRPGTRRDRRRAVRPARRRTDLAGNGDRRHRRRGARRQHGPGRHDRRARRPVRERRGRRPVRARRDRDRRRRRHRLGRVPAPRSPPASRARPRTRAGARSPSTSARPFGAGWALPADGEYVLCALATDEAGHASRTTRTVTVDRTAPDALIAAVDPYVRGSIDLASPSSDATSGIGQVDFQRAPSGADAWVLVGSALAGPYGTTLDTTALADGDYDLRAFVTDRAGNAAASTAVTTRVDNTPPTGSVTSPTAGTNLRLTVPVTSDSADGGSGVASALSRRARPAPTRGPISPPPTPTRRTGWTGTRRPPPTASTTSASSPPTAPATRHVRARSPACASTTRRRPARSPIRARTCAAPSRSPAPPPTRAAASRPSPSSARPPGAGTWTTIETDTADPFGASARHGRAHGRALRPPRARHRQRRQRVDGLDREPPRRQHEADGRARRSGRRAQRRRHADRRGGGRRQRRRLGRVPARAGRLRVVDDARDRHLRPVRRALRHHRGRRRALRPAGRRDRPRRQPGDAPASASRRVDNTAPTTSASGVPSGPTSGPVTITLAASDGGVGVAQTTLPHRRRRAPGLLGRDHARTAPTARTRCSTSRSTRSATSSRRTASRS